MGSQSKAKQKRRRYLNNSENTRASDAANLHQQKDQPLSLNLSTLPGCVQKLQSTEWAELEEACRDICYFSLQPKHHANFVQVNVPVRLAQLLFFTSPLLSGATTQPVESSEVPNPPALSIHRDVVYMQLAAAEALCNLITNSQEDEVLDLLAQTPSVGNGSDADGISGVTACLPPITSLGKQLGDLLQNVFQWIKAAHENINPQDWLHGKDAKEEHHDDDDDEAEPFERTVGDSDAGAMPGQEVVPPRPHRKQKRDNHSSNYLLLLALLEQILRLLTVCLESTTSTTSDATTTRKGNECVGITEVFSSPEAMNLLLEILDASVNTTWENLLHPAGYFAHGTPSPQGALPDGDANNGATPPQAQGPEVGEPTPMLQALRMFKQEETKRLASICSAMGDVFYALSPDNLYVASFLGQGGSGDSAGQLHITPAQQCFLNKIVDAVLLQQWWSDAPECLLPALDAISGAPSAVNDERSQKPALLWLTQQHIYCQLMKTTICIQGTLLNTSAHPDNIRRILPTIVAVLRKTLPMQLWRTTLPLLLEDVGHALEESVRAACVDVTTSRMRCALVAVRIFQTITEAVCSHNQHNLDDDVAFAQNPHAALLRESGSLHVFGLVLQDVLWLSQRSSTETENPTVDVMRQREQHLLREVAKANAEVTTLQFLILSMEVSVWNVASPLLLMVPVESLGDPAQIWRAILHAVEQRYALISDAAKDLSSVHPGIAGEADSLPSSIAAQSVSARQLLWLQLESLVQMLWTLQRKQVKVQGGVLHSSNQLRAQKSDVDLLIRLAWERREWLGKGGLLQSPPCMPTLTQACVGTIGLLCVSMGEVEATVVGSRFALAILANYGSDGGSTTDSSTSSLLQLDRGVVASGTNQIANPVERRAWLQRLFTVDSIVSARSEAANALMDFFLDERYDKEVYVPQGIQKSLSGFMLQLREYIKQRLLITKFWKRNYQVAVEPEDLEQWQEIEGNLDGFLDYKAQNIRNLQKH